MGLSLVEIRVLNGSLVLGKQSAGSKRVFFLLDLELVRYLFYTCLLYTSDAADE